MQTTPKETFSVVLLESVSHALRAEKLIKAAGIPCKLIPVPRQLSSDCGVCLRFPSSETEAVRENLTGKLDLYEIHLLSTSNPSI